MRILVIESDSSSANSLREHLEGRGLDVIVTDDGKRGVDLARELTPDAVVLAVELGDKPTGGYAFCNKLKKDDALRKLPLVLISSQATEETFAQHRKLKTHAEEYLRKPFDADALFAALENHLTLPATADDEELELIEDSLEVEELDALELEEGPTGGEVLDGDDDLLRLDAAFDHITGGPQEEQAVDDEEGEELEIPEVEEPESEQDAERALEDALGALGAESGDESEAEEEIEVAPPLAEEEELVDRTIIGTAPTAPPARRADRDAPLTPGPTATAAAEASLELAELKGRVAELEAQLEAKQRELDERAQEADAARSSSGSREKDYLQQKSDVVRKDKELLRLREELTSREREALALQERQTELESQAIELQEELTRKDDQARGSQQRADSASAQVRKLEATLSALKSDAAMLPALQEHASKLQSERDGLADDLAVARDEVATLQARVSEAEGELQAERERAQDAERERDGLREELDATRAELEELRLASSEAREAAESATAAAEAEVERLRARVEELEGEASRNEERVVKAYQKIKGDEKVKEKTKKALGIALQLLEEHAAAEDEEART